jgi:hypothetical protein
VRLLNPLIGEDHGRENEEQDTRKNHDIDNKLRPDFHLLLPVHLRFRQY